MDVPLLSLMKRRPSMAMSHTSNGYKTFSIGTGKIAGLPEDLVYLVHPRSSRKKINSRSTSHDLGGKFYLQVGSGRLGTHPDYPPVATYLSFQVTKAEVQPQCEIEFPCVQLCNSSWKPRRSAKTLEERHAMTTQCPRRPIRCCTKISPRHQPRKLSTNRTAFD